MTTNDHYTGWNRPLRVLLTATSNPYLDGELPIVGLLTVHEMTTRNTAQPRKVTFRRERADGTYAAPVHVDDPAFNYPAPPKCPVCNDSRTVTYHHRYPAGGGGSNTTGPCHHCTDGNV